MKLFNKKYRCVRFIFSLVFLFVCITLLWVNSVSLFAQDSESSGSQNNGGQQNNTESTVEEDYIYIMSPDWYKNPLSVPKYKEMSKDKFFFTGLGKAELGKNDREYAKSQAIFLAKKSALSSIGIVYYDDNDFILFNQINIEDLYSVLENDKISNKQTVYYFVIISISRDDFEKAKIEAPNYLAKRLLEKEKFDEITNKKLEKINEDYQNLVNQFFQTELAIKAIQEYYNTVFENNYQSFEDIIIQKKLDLLAEFLKEIEEFYSSYQNPKGFAEKQKADAAFKNIITMIDNKQKIIENTIDQYSKDIVSLMDIESRKYFSQIEYLIHSLYSLKSEIDSNFNLLLQDESVKSSQELWQSVYAIKTNFFNVIDSTIINLENEKKAIEEYSASLLTIIKEKLVSLKNMIIMEIKTERDYQYYKYFPKTTVFERIPLNFGSMIFSYNMSSIQDYSQPMDYIKFDLNFYQAFFDTIFLKANIDLSYDSFYFTMDPFSIFECNINIQPTFIFPSHVTLNLGITLPVFLAMNGESNLDGRIYQIMIGMGFLSETFDQELWFTNIYVRLLNGLSLDVKTKIVFSPYVSMFLNFGSILYKPLSYNNGLFIGKTYYEISIIFRFLPSYNLGITYSSSHYGMADFFLPDVTNSSDRFIMIIIFDF